MTQNERQNTTIPALTVSEAARCLTALYGGAIRAGIPIRLLPAPFLWGPPGIGKSDTVRQLAAGLEEGTGKKVVVTDVRLLLFSPVDLRGVPVPDATRTFTDWLRPRVFDMDGSDGIVNLLFLDELSAAPQSVQAAAYQLTLDRRIGEHALPDNCAVIAAGNRTTDQSVSYKMPKALCNRLCHFEIRADFASWKAWAYRSGIDARIIGYLSFDQSRLYREPEVSDTAFPTPRTWEFVSRILAASEKTPRECHVLISAAVGTDAALEFEEWCRISGKLPAAEDILCGAAKDIPKQQDLLFALSASLCATLFRKAEAVTVRELENACAYAARFPTDYACAFFTDLRENARLAIKLMRCRALTDWITKHPEGAKAWMKKS